MKPFTIFRENYKVCTDGIVNSAGHDQTIKMFQLNLADPVTIVDAVGARRVKEFKKFS
jgi:hypothetical protein